MNLRKKHKTEFGQSPPSDEELNLNSDNEGALVNSSDTTQSVTVDDELKRKQTPLKETETKKKRGNKDDGAYSRKSYSNDGKVLPKKPGLEPHAYHSMLYDNATTIDIDKKKPLKTSVMIDWQALYEANKDRSIDWQSLGDALVKSFDEVKSFRKLDKVINFSPNGSPTKGTTPDGKTVLTRTKKIGFLSFYDNRAVTPHANLTSQTSIDPKSEFYNSESYQALIQISESVKKQEALINAELLKKTRDENAQKSGRSQNKVMVKKGKKPNEGSANIHANATKLFRFEIPMQWQWAHLIPHFVWGDKSQSADVLVGATKPSNIDMDSVEAQLKKLSAAYPQGFTLIAEATLIPGTHIGITMKYFIKTKDFCLPFEFDLQTPNQPHVSQAAYLHHLVKTMINQMKEPPKSKRTINYMDMSDEEVDSTTTAKEEKESKSNDQISSSAQFPFFDKRKVETTTTTKSEENNKEAPAAIKKNNS